MQELHSNIMSYSVQGSFNDPGPTSAGSRGAGMMINLQTAISVFRDDPRIYNPVSYLICATLLLVWAFVTLRSGSSPTRAWLAIAAIAPLTLLPVYHRLYDTKLLVLTVPACAMLWAEGGLIGWLALLVNTAGFVLTGDLVWVILHFLIGYLHIPATRLSVQILTIVEAFPVPLILLIMGIFYLWVYALRCSASATSAESGSLEETPIAPRQFGSELNLKRPLDRLIPRLPDVPDRKRD
jgi:hypothetical protein